jgi:pyruvate dehydrogenase E2 component (dihydrolipoamide acetyltransferase)
MAAVVRMPAALAGATEGAIQTWLAQVGQTITAGEPLAEIETEKAVVEYASEVGGTVGRLLVEPGLNIEVGTPIAVILAAGEGDDALDAALAGAGVASGGAAQAAAAPEPTVAAAPAAPEPETAPAAAEAPAPATASAPAATSAPDAPAAAQSGSGDRSFASPIVRRLARERGIDLASLSGTGPNGRIVRRDLDAAPTAAASPQQAPAAPAEAPATASSGEFTDVPHTGMRRAIARRLTESKSTVPHFYLVADCRVDELVALRKAVNESADVKVSLNDFVLKAAAAAFLDVPEANVTWGESALRRYSTVDMAVAVSIEGGLVTPVLRSVEKQSLTEIARNVADLAERARAGRLRQPELEGGSFAVSNLGMYGVTEFSAIINPPQSGILAVGLARQIPVVEDGQLAVGTVMTVTLSADHRALDGALAAQWLAAFVKRIEHPLSILV